MHGRIKVKTTAEQDEAKRQEREKKLKLYKGGTAAVFKKRKNGEFGTESLVVTAELLSANPDFYTLWNIRREIFTYFKVNNPTDAVQTSLQNELGFLEQCLRVNPKSYGTWHHRGWIMENMPDPDWARELLLCNKFLEYDERNFHCWDYRRLVVKHASVSPEDELAFTTNKIESNFSNYSSWHYRSKLLPIVHGDEKHPGRLQDDRLVSECLLAQNAFFTDPNDQSAWFYHRWLLGRSEGSPQIESIYVSLDYPRVVVSLSKAVDLHRYSLLLSIDSPGFSSLTDKWESASGERFSSIWIIPYVVGLHKSDSTVEISVTLENQPAVSLDIKPGQNTATWRHHYSAGTRFRHELSAVTSDVLTQELTSLQQLHDLEPDNKWVLLATVSLMRALDPLRYEQETIDDISKLIEVDPMRKNYYKDIRSKFMIENTLERSDFQDLSLDLSKKELTSLFHYDQMAILENIDLSFNSLSHFSGAQFLPCVAVMKLDSNSLTSCEWFVDMKFLKQLSLKNNKFTTLESLMPLKNCKNLRHLDLADNPISSKKNEVISLLPNIKITI